MRNKGRHLAFAVAGALVLGACGAGSGSASESSATTTGKTGANSGVVIHDRLVNAAASTVDAGSARIAMKISMSMPGTTARGTVTADGVTDFTSHDTQLTMDMGSLLSQIAPDRANGDFTVEMRMVDNTIYMKYPAAFAPLMGSQTPWLAIDVSGAAKSLGLADGALDQYQQSDPTQYLRYLAGVSSDVETVGHDNVRGVGTTHYHATIDLSKGVTRLPNDLRDKLGLDAEVLSKMYARLQRQLGTSKLPVDVWIDGNGLLRRMTMATSATGAGAGGAGVGIDMQMYDYGVDVNVVAPPSDQVTDLFSMLRGATGFGSSSGSGSA